MTSQLYLVVRKSDLRYYVLESDRQYFSKPVPVEPLYSCVETKMLVVRDPVRGCTFPVLKNYLRQEWQLTHRQRMGQL